eukprot:CAMPEP_0175466902 /NCGR_PEP_ID=MMETSP0095-20121207/71046_1 /TAXON_ID=311494 /ORGANISM="Alexandrium monilatum, Strain CCMP3105" /LENGTH=128 /DNA_ID=CAMNT_0016768263 /DNA_START=30 /DNA_END=412 /DNA_ORIENTATION=-
MVSAVVASAWRPSTEWLLAEAAVAASSSEAPSLRSTFLELRSPAAPSERTRRSLSTPARPPWVEEEAAFLRYVHSFHFDPRARLGVALQRSTASGWSPSLARLRGQAAQEPSPAEREAPCQEPHSDRR